MNRKLKFLKWILLNKGTKKGSKYVNYKDIKQTNQHTVHMSKETNSNHRVPFVDPIPGCRDPEQVLEMAQVASDSDNQSILRN